MLSYLLRVIFLALFGPGPRRLSTVVSELCSIGITLYVFKMTSQLVPEARLFDSSRNYFEFLLVGEIALLVPLSYFELSVQRFVSYHATGYVQTLEDNQICPYAVVRTMSLKQLWLPLLRLVTILVGGLCIGGVQFAPNFYAGFILTQLLSVAAMIHLSEVVTHVYHLTQRGLKLFYSLNTLLAIVGGAYFPVNYLSPLLRNWGVWVFPQTIALQLSRLNLSQGVLGLAEVYSYFVLYVGVLFLLSRGSRTLFTKAIQRRRVRHVILSQSGQS